MSEVFFQELGLPAPTHNLAVGGGTHAQNTGRAMEGVERLIGELCPDWVLVYGDTDSTLAGAIAAAKANVPLIHVEAGLRSFNMAMPEEVNRILTDRVSTLLFAPSEVAVENLRQEGVANEQVHFTGDVMFDAVRVFGEIAGRRSRILTELSLSEQGYVLATLHRKENVDHPERLRSIILGLEKAPLPVILPLHPRTRRRLADDGLVLGVNIRVIDPVGYFDMLVLQRNAAVIATDSGGVQKEAYFHGVPGVILRDETEWVELVRLGHNTLVGADTARIAEALAMPPRAELSTTVYGQGYAADLIAAKIAEMSA